MEYGHEQAVADGVNVDFDVYRIRTRITEQGATRRGRATSVDVPRPADPRRCAGSELDDDLTYTANQLDRDVVAEDQIRTVVRTFRDTLFTEIFPGRTEVPKTLIFAKDDSHAEDIVQIVREEFGKGNDFCQKITYRTTGKKPEDLLAEFRNSYNPRIAVTVDMIATGTDVKPLEIVHVHAHRQEPQLLRADEGARRARHRPTTCAAVTPDATAKTHFVIVDAVGVCETGLIDPDPPLERKRSVPFKTLLDAVAWGSIDADTASSLGVRLTRLDKTLTPLQRSQIAGAAGGQDLLGAGRAADRGGRPEPADRPRPGAGRISTPRRCPSRSRSRPRVTSCWPRPPNRCSRAPSCAIC